MTFSFKESASEFTFLTRIGSAKALLEIVYDRLGIKETLSLRTT
jgi:hypothetical protein